MCLATSTSRRPLHNTAYKVLYRKYNTCLTPYTNTIVPLVFNEWIEDKKPEIPLSYTQYYHTSYRPGFHCFLDLADAIAFCVFFNMSTTGEYIVYRVDFDDVVDYGVEYSVGDSINLFKKPRDVVVARKIKYVEHIEV